MKTYYREWYFPPTKGIFNNPNNPKHQEIECIWYVDTDKTSKWYIWDSQKNRWLKWAFLNIDARLGKLVYPWKDGTRFEVISEAEAFIEIL